MKRAILAATTTAMLSGAGYAAAQTSGGAAQLLRAARGQMEALNGDSAFLLLTVVFRASPTASERVRAFTLLGITELMRSNRQAGRDAFEQALRLDRTLRIDSLADLHSEVRVVFGELQPLYASGGSSYSESAASNSTTSTSLLGNRIRSGRLRYRFMQDGQESGTATQTVVRVREGERTAWRMTFETRRAGGGDTVSMAETLVVDAGTLAPIRRRSVELSGSRRFLRRVDYSSGRVRVERLSGPANRPDSLSMPTTLDTTLGPDILDISSLWLVLSALSYSAGARWDIPMFSAESRNVYVFTFTVVGEATVVVPAGGFTCWRVEVTGLTQRYVYDVAKDAPIVVRSASSPTRGWELTSRN